MNRKEQEAIINRLLFVTLVSIFASLALWMIYRGYMNTAYILAMPNIMITISIVGAVISAIIGWKIYQGKQKTSSKLFPYFLIAIIATVSSLIIKYNNVLYVIYTLWIAIAIYLVVNVAYNVYKLIAK